MELKDYILDVPDFPTPGVTFRDITPLLANPQALEYCVDGLVAPFVNKGIELVAGLESRGFILGAPAALKLKAGFVPIRKKGKLPRRAIRESLVKEYGEDVIEMHTDAVKPGARVLLVDDVLATGGTLESAISLLKQAGASIAGVSLLINLSYLPGKERVCRLLPSNISLHYLLEY